MEIIFHSHANKTHFHKKGCALGLILKATVIGTRKWPISFVIYTNLIGQSFFRARRPVQAFASNFDWLIAMAVSVISFRFWRPTLKRKNKQLTEIQKQTNKEKLSVCKKLLRTENVN